MGGGEGPRGEGGTRRTPEPAAAGGLLRRNICDDMYDMHTCVTTASKDASELAGAVPSAPPGVCRRDSVTRTIGRLDPGPEPCGQKRPADTAQVPRAVALLKQNQPRILDCSVS